MAMCTFFIESSLKSSTLHGGCCHLVLSGGDAGWVFSGCSCYLSLRKSLTIYTQYTWVKSAYLCVVATMLATGSDRKG